jgi:hypothetical protein
VAKNGPNVVTWIPTDIVALFDSAVYSITAYHSTLAGFPVPALPLYAMQPVPGDPPAPSSVFRKYKSAAAA